MEALLQSHEEIQDAAVIGKKDTVFSFPSKYMLMLEQKVYGGKTGKESCDLQSNTHDDGVRMVHSVFCLFKRKYVMPAALQRLYRFFVSCRAVVCLLQLRFPNLLDRCEY